MCNANFLTRVTCKIRTLTWARFSNSVRHLLSSSSLKVQGWPGGSKLGASSLRRLHSCAYIDEYFGSSSAFSKMRRITPFSTLSESNSSPSRSSLSFWNFSGVSLLRMPRTCTPKTRYVKRLSCTSTMWAMIEDGHTFLCMMSCLASPSGTSWCRSEDGGTQRRLGGTGVRPAARSTGPDCRALSVLRPVSLPHAHPSAYLHRRRAQIASNDALQQTQSNDTCISCAPCTTATSVSI